VRRATCAVLGPQRAALARRSIDKIAHGRRGGAGEVEIGDESARGWCEGFVTRAIATQAPSGWGDYGYGYGYGSEYEYEYEDGDGAEYEYGAKYEYEYEFEFEYEFEYGNECGQ
jgi:hypothetical protein